MSVRADNYWLSPAERAIAVTPSDSATLVLPSGVSGTNQLGTKALYIGGAGNVKVTLTGQKDSQAVTFTAPPVGTVLPIQATKVFSTGTTATLIIALY